MQSRGGSPGGGSGQGQGLAHPVLGAGGVPAVAQVLGAEHEPSWDCGERRGEGRGVFIEALVVCLQMFCLSSGHADHHMQHVKLGNPH